MFHAQELRRPESCTVAWPVEPILTGASDSALVDGGSRTVPRLQFTMGKATEHEHIDGTDTGATSQSTEAYRSFSFFAFQWNCAKKRSNLLARLALEDVCIHWLHTTLLPWDGDRRSEIRVGKSFWMAHHLKQPFAYPFANWMFVECLSKLLSWFLLVLGNEGLATGDDRSGWLLNVWCNTSGAPQISKHLHPVSKLQ